MDDQVLIDGKKKFRVRLVFESRKQHSLATGYRRPLL